MIDITQLCKTFHPGTVNENRSINKLSLKIHKGDFVTVIGSNGAGKSTLMNLLAGSLSADSGRIAIDETEITQSKEHERAQWISRVFQDPMKGTASSLTIEENLALAMKRTGRRSLSPALKKSYHQRFRQELAKLHLGLEDRLSDVIGLLSGGQRQSITLLMAAILKPEIILLDEHTAALDPKTAQTVMELTDEIVQSHKLTALMITHNMEHALKYGNRLVMLHKGQVAYDLNEQEKNSLKEEDLLKKFHIMSASDRMEEQ